MVQIYRKDIQRKKQNADNSVYLVRGSYESSVAEVSISWLPGAGRASPTGRGCLVTKGRRGRRKQLMQEPRQRRCTVCSGNRRGQQQGDEERGKGVGRGPVGKVFTWGLDLVLIGVRNI